MKRLLARGRGSEALDADFPALTEDWRLILTMHTLPPVTFMLPLVTVLDASASVRSQATVRGCEFDPVCAPPF